MKAIILLVLLLTTYAFAQKGKSNGDQSCKNYYY